MHFVPTMAPSHQQKGYPRHVPFSFTYTSVTTKGLVTSSANSFRLNGEAELRGFEMSDLHPDIHIMAAQDMAFPARTADIQSPARSH